MTVAIALGVLALLIAASAGSIAYVRRVLAREPSWHPGDDLPEVPQDAPIRNWMK